MHRTPAVEYNSNNVAVIGDDIMVHDNRPHIPNAETLAAMTETDEFFRRIKAGEIQPRFNNLAEFFISLFSEDDEK